MLNENTCLRREQTDDEFLEIIRKNEQKLLIEY